MLSLNTTVSMALALSTLTLARADDTSLHVETSLALEYSSAYTQRAQAPSADTPSTLLDGELEGDRPGFGEAGSWYWSVGGGVGFSGESVDPMGQLTFGTFLTDDFELNFGMRGWRFIQEGGRDASGVSAALGFRWHFIHKPRQTVYVHTGIGLLQATRDVPADGTPFNFTPTFGFGTTIKLGESDTRLDLGARWHHISNATTSGSDDNPARDGIMVYFAVIFPF